MKIAFFRIKFIQYETVVWFFLNLRVKCLKNNSSSSSLCATNSIFECCGLLNIWFPLIMILDAANPIVYFQFLLVVSYVSFPFFLWSPLWSYWYQFPVLYFFTILSSVTRCKWPNQLYRCAFMWFILFGCLTNSSSVLIHLLSPVSFVVPMILLNTSISKYH